MEAFPKAFSEPPLVLDRIDAEGALMWGTVLTYEGSPLFSILQPEI